ncbi:hypothetical protein PMZ80_009817 [Knufia obscura]|uniref:BHLH domain-containing protein n=1 Tax=Knufia obscura TaxID=1635080 RepID=A0ABR0RBV2_9EURO|nr:hypothetical protein PMZ80_009817 [Knufia obscura]
MPRAKFPPTPGTSTGPTAQEKANDMESSFILPPAAMNRSPPTSPVIQRKRTLSGSTKNKEELPPPPSRARKIIQMKPKEEAPAPAVPATSKTTSPKRKQPAASSAAGRKIARKTAHSIIERRRRSKMNEEFGVLKDMIPACSGVEMHKLAILQAGIEYVKYLQGCVDKLQDDRRPHRRRGEEDDEDGEEAGESFDRNNVHSHGINTTKSSTATKHVKLESCQPKTVTSPHDQGDIFDLPPPLVAHTPTATGVSPAFNAIHFSPDLSRTYSNQYHVGKQSPNILPLPQAAMPVGAMASQGGQEGHAEATATAALMMLTNDRRAVGGSGRGGGMSVRDLLSH